MFKKERDMETIKYRNNLEGLKNIKIISKDTYEELLEKDVQHCSEASTEGSTRMAWIGINPPLYSISFEALYHLTLEILPYKHYKMCVEQNTKTGLRPHIHALAKVGEHCRPNKEINRLGKLFGVNSECIEFKISNNNLVNGTRKKYLEGDKVEDKLEYVNDDIRDRKLFNLPNFISKGNI